MSTGEKFLEITENRILGWESFKDYFFDYLSSKIDTNSGQTYKHAGTFELIGIQADGTDKIKLVDDDGNDFPENIIHALDGAGNYLNLNAGLSQVQDIQFANNTGTTYYVGIQKAHKPASVFVNPVDGMPVFDYNEEIIGYEGVPNSVSVAGDGLTMIVNSITEAGFDHTGRSVYVYKMAPGSQALTDAVAIETCTVSFSGGNNQITTVANFGQGVSPSTTASDYRVVLIGPRVETSAFADTTVCLIGTVDGNTGGAPTVFDTSVQDVFNVVLSDLTHITRYETSGATDRLKVDVKAPNAESSIDQIRVTHLGAGGGGSDLVTFKVTEAGNVTIEGDLTVKGTTIQEDVVEIQSNLTITENLIAGDADADAHSIKGIWTHQNAGETVTFFQVDPSNGIGIGDVAHASGLYELYVNGDSLFAGDLLPSGATRDIGAVGTKWQSVYCQNIYADASAIGGDLKPAADDAYDLGDNTTPLEWRNIYIDGTAYLDSLNVSDAASEGVTSNFVPDAASTYTLGASGRQWSAIYVDNIDITGNFLPSVTNLQDIGSTGAKWRTGYFGTDLNVDGTANLATGSITYLAVSSVLDEGCTNHLVPATDDAYDLGTTSRQWRNAYFDGQVATDVLVVSSTADEGVSSNLVPATDNTWSLGNPTYRWENLYVSNNIVTKDLQVSSVNGEGVQSNFQPILDDTYALGSSSYRWTGVWGYTGNFLELFVGTGTGEGIGSEVYPDTTNTRRIGVLDRVFQSCAVGQNGLYLQSTAGVEESDWHLWVDTGGANELLKFTSLGDVTADYTFMTVTRQANDADIENIDFYADTQIFLQSPLIELEAGTRIHLDSPFVEVYGNLEPDAAATANLGNASFPWKKFYLSNAGGEGMASNLKPDTDATYSLGNAIATWKDFFLSDAAGDGFGGNFVPTANNTYNLGNTSYAWETLYMSTNETGSVDGFMHIESGAGGANKPWVHHELSGSAWGDNGGIIAWGTGDTDYSGHGSHYFFLRPRTAKTVYLFGFYTSTPNPKQVIYGTRLSDAFWRNITFSLGGHNTDASLAGYLELDQDGSDTYPPALVITNHSPAASDSAPKVGSIYFDSSYLYVYTAASTWKRVALTGGY